MKIVCISDTHNQLDKVKIPDGDILIHAGDFTIDGNFKEIAKFNHDLKQLPHKYKVVIPGNHDLMFEDSPQTARMLMQSSKAIVLMDELVEIEGIKIWGSPWQPEFCSWAFNLPRGPMLKEKWDLIPTDADIVVTHGPPYGVGDLVEDWDDNKKLVSVGCNELKKALLNRVRPKAHICGHVHVGYGSRKSNGINFINAAILNEQYVVQNKPIVFHV